MDSIYPGWRDMSRSVYNNIVKNDDISALKYIYESLIPKLPKEYIACAACEFDRFNIFEWAISDVSSYKMIITYAVRYNRLQYLQCIETEIQRIDGMKDIIINIASYHGYNDITEWISKHPY